MIEPKQTKEKSLLGSSRTKAFRLIRTGSALLLFAGSATPFYGQSPEELKTADKKSQLSPRSRACSVIKPMCANFCREGPRTQRSKVFSNYRAGSPASTPQAIFMRIHSASLPKRRQL